MDVRKHSASLTVFIITLATVLGLGALVTPSCSQAQENVETVTPVDVTPPPDLDVTDISDVLEEEASPERDTKIDKVKKWFSTAGANIKSAWQDLRTTTAATGNPGGEVPPE